MLKDGRPRENHGAAADTQLPVNTHEREAILSHPAIRRHARWPKTRKRFQQKLVEAAQREKLPC